MNISITQGVLRVMARNHALGARELYEHLYGETVRGKKLNPRSVHTILSRMKRNGLLKNKDRKWEITSEGEELLKGKNAAIRHFFPSKIVRSGKLPRTTIVIFDIPEKKKRYREWLRSELISFDFNLVQKSVWLGPALPKEFVEYLGACGILKYVRFFRASEQDLI